MSPLTRLLPKNGTSKTAQQKITVHIFVIEKNHTLSILWEADRAHTREPIVVTRASSGSSAGVLYITG
jgi:hypothetical protein